MLLLKSRRQRESVIVQTMIKMYCMSHHGSIDSLCSACNALSVYAEKRLLSCMYGEAKPVCKECPVHCYSPPMRDYMRKVMRWAGPRMIVRNPFFAVMHMIDNFMSANPKKRSSLKTKQK